MEKSINRHAIKLKSSGKRIRKRIAKFKAEAILLPDDQNTYIRLFGHPVLSYPLITLTFWGGMGRRNAVKQSAIMLQIKI